MKKANKSITILIILMTIFSLTSVLNINMGGKTLELAPVTLIIGIVAFFVTRKTNDDVREGLDYKNIFGALKDKKLMLLVLMPLFADMLCFGIGKLFLPAYIEHLKARTGFLSFQMIPLLLLELIIAALGEEIAWRAFYLKQLSKMLPYVPSLLISSALFALCHFNRGNAVVVAYDLFFVFVNAVLYGIIFKKTDNAWISTIGHFLANLFGVVVLMFL